MPALARQCTSGVETSKHMQVTVGIVDAGTIMSVWIINTYHHTEPEASGCLGF